MTINSLFEVVDERSKENDAAGARADGNYSSGCVSSRPKAKGAHMQGKNDEVAVTKNSAWKRSFNCSRRKKHILQE